jgi:N-acetylglucosamine-6-sulfatase
MQRRSLISSLAAFTGFGCSPARRNPLALERLPGARPRNIVFILSDDHRYDAMGFMGHPFLKTPAMDRIAGEGVHFQNAFVTTSLCSPSRASILTGQYAHTHGVVSNMTLDRPTLRFFPQYLQTAGYETAFIGKWHMGSSSDRPRLGFDHWVSFPGQGEYYPSANTQWNVNGKHVPQRGYITDELTDYAVEWLRGRGQKPFFLYLSHKGVHLDFEPAKRHQGCYKDARVTPPKTMADTRENYFGKPRWVKDQRNSTHGVDFPDQDVVPIEVKYRKYCETLRAVDDSVARVMDELERRNQLDSTLFAYMGDNGFAWGEHGLQDKRTAYEESMRVPLIARCPEMFKAGIQAPAMVANIDIAPTLLAAAGLRAPAHMQGRNFLPVVQNPKAPWRDSFIYEYFWERKFPETPTTHAIRTDRYKYIHYWGIWDTEELYDLQADPLETKNLIASKEHEPIWRKLNKELFDTLEATGGMQLPLYRDASQPQNYRRVGGSAPGEFPPWMMRDMSKSKPETELG